MVRKARTNALDVWMNGERVGVWSIDRGGTHLFEYSDEWLRSPRSRPLSLSLPLLPGMQVHRGDAVAAWFDNLLPDSQHIRERLARRFGTGSTRAMDLLAAIGRDCVGAVQLLPAGDDPGDVRRIEAEPLDDAAIAGLLRRVTSSPTLGIASAPDEFRISIAGAQEKTALLRLDGRWYAPRGATPTTHMLKLPLGLVGHMRADMRDSVENEWLCMQFLQELGLPVAVTRIERFRDEVGEEKVLVVERFDREPVAFADGAIEWILRIPQEDLCQATGTPGDSRYESDGGPGIRAVLQVLAAGQNAQVDLLTFARAQLAFWLLAATDGHAKNFSIFLRRHGYVMTPLYDVVSAWPIIGRGPNELAYQDATLAMALRGSRPYRHLHRIPARQWRQLADQTGVGDALERMTEMVERAAEALRRLEGKLPPGFPEYVWERIRRGVLQHREHFLSAATRLDPDE